MSVSHELTVDDPIARYQNIGCISLQTNVQSSPRFPIGTDVNLGTSTGPTNLGQYKNIYARIKADGTILEQSGGILTIEFVASNLYKINYTQSFSFIPYVFPTIASSNNYNIVVFTNTIAQAQVVIFDTGGVGQASDFLVNIYGL